MPDAGASFESRSLGRFAQIARVVALLAFLLPWVTVSCAGQQVASVSGLRLATGMVTVRNPMTGALESHSGTPNMAVLIAAVAIVLALLVGFVRMGRSGVLARAGLSGAAALLSIYAVLVDIPRQLDAGMQQRQIPGGENDFGSSLADSMAHVIRVDAAIGLWIALLALIAACALDGLAGRRTAGAP
jgi:MFS superfamily sulfate permease-like transporter